MLTDDSVHPKLVYEIATQDATRFALDLDGSVPLTSPLTAVDGEAVTLGLLMQGFLRQAVCIVSSEQLDAVVTCSAPKPNTAPGQDYFAHLFVSHLYTDGGGQRLTWPWGAGHRLKCLAT